MNPYSPPLPAAGPYAAVPAPYGAPAGIVSEGAIEMLRQTRPWVIFLAIVAFLGSAGMFLLSLFMFAVGFIMPGGLKGAGGGAAAFGGAMEMVYGAMGFVYLPFAAMCIYQGIKLWAYGSAIGRLMASRAAVDLEEALKHQKSYWKFSGISVIVIVVLYILLIVGVMVVGVAAGLKG
jgi:hypothetical protein